MSVSLVFIPDISGFTNFVTTTEISHSQHIISELLDVLLRANRLDLTISEIEGDAILFYKHNYLPSLKEIFEQAGTMFLAFHSHLRRYDRDRICHCGACSTASSLSLKIIAHCGNLGFITVQDRKKPHGEDVILAHLLLKNSIPQSEYLLITQPLFDKVKKDQEISIPNWAHLEEGKDRYDRMGELAYQYILLSPLLNEVPDLPPVEHPKKIRNPIKLSIEVHRDMYEVFEIISNLDFRLSWNPGIDELDFEKDRVNRSGTRHVCLIGEKEIEFETVKNDFGSNRLVYGERLLKVPLMQDFTVYYILEETTASTRVHLEAHYLPKPLIGWLMVPFLRYRFKKVFETYLPLLKKACERNHKLLTVKGE